MKTSGSVIVAETGSDQVKLVQVVRTSAGVEVAKLYLRRFDSINDDLVKSLSDDFRKLNLARVPVIACLPRQVVNVRLLEVPSTDPDEIADMVELQVGRQTPYLRDEIVADHRIIGPGREGYTRVMLIIVQRILMRQRFCLLEDAGLRVESMSVSSEGILNWYRSVWGVKDEKESAVLLDVDAGYTDFAVVSGGRLVFTKSILVGARQLLEEPEKWKPKFVQEVSQSLEVFRGETAGGVAPGRMLLTGAGPRIEGLADALVSRSGMAVHAVDCLGKVKKSPLLPDLGQGDFRSASFTPLVGMAAAPGDLEFNLVPDTVRVRRGIETKARSLTAMGTLVLGVLTLSSMIATGMIHGKVRYLSELTERLEKTDDAARDVERKKQTIVMVMARMNSKQAPVSIMLELHRITPPGVRYDAVSIEAGRSLVLKGRASGYPEINRLRAGLEASDVVFQNVRSRKETKDREGLIEFELVCTAEVEE